MNTTARNLNLHSSSMPPSVEPPGNIFNQTHALASRIAQERNLGGEHKHETSAVFEASKKGLTFMANMQLQQGLQNKKFGQERDLGPEKGDVAPKTPGPGKR